MKIVMSLPDVKLSSGGPSRSITLLAAAVGGCGINLCVFAVDDGEKIFDPVDGNNYELRMISTKKNRVDRYLALRKIKKELIDEFGRHDDLLVHDHGIWTLFNNEVVKTCISLKIPYLISPHGMLEPWALKNKRLKKMIAMDLYQHENLKKARVLCATAYQEAESFRSIGLRNPIAVIPNIVENPRLMNEGYEKNGKYKTVLFMSRIDPKKGLKNLIEAWSRLRPADWQLIIAGPDQAGHEDILKSLVAHHNLGSQIRFIGPKYKEEKWRLISTADVFVLPTFSENFGLVVGEALAMGVPVITTKGAPWQDLETRDCGWWIDIGVEPLAVALQHAMSLSDNSRMEMGERGKKLIAEKFSYEHVASQSILLYEWILGGGNPPSFVLTD